MKDKKKVIVPLLLAGVTATGVVSNISQVQQVQVQAAESGDITQVEGAEVKVTRFQALEDSGLVFKDTFKVGDKVYLPNVEVDGGVSVEYTVKKDKKTIEIKTDATHSDAKYFDAKYQGYYDLTITATSSSEGVNQVPTTLKKMSVFVERDEATIKLPTNSSYVIPAKMPKNQENLKIPAPSVIYDKDGNELEENAGSLTEGDLVVYLVNPKNEKVDLTLDATKSFYAVDSTKLSELGTYQIVYEYKRNDAVITRLENSFQIVDSENYNTSDIKLKMIYQSSMPSTGNVNSDISIPKVKVVDTNASSTDAINAYVEVKVTNLNDPSEVIEVDYENFTFRPKKEGTYTVQYQAFIGLFGCQTLSAIPGAPIIVSDTEAPSVLPTYEYEYDADGEINKVNGVAVTVEEGETQREAAERMLVDRRVDIPSAVVKGVEFTIPAVYSIDNFDKMSSVNGGITIKRTYRNANGGIETVTVDPNKNATIKFDVAGNSEIRYQATDANGNTKGEVVYSVVVYETAKELEDGETTIKLNVGTTLVSDREETLSFAKPTATDTYDKYVDVKTYLVKNNTETNIDNIDLSANSVEKLTETDGDGKYVLDIKKLSKECNNFTIVVEATIDSTLSTSRTKLTTRKAHTVNIQKVNDDNEAPVFSIEGLTNWNTALKNKNSSIMVDKTGTINNAGYLLDSSGNTVPVTTGSSINKAAFDQGSSVLTIPTVEFTDAQDSNLTISIDVTDRKGNKVSTVDQESVVREEVGGNYVYTVSGASFKLSSYGMYVVTFTAQDYAGNIVIRSFGIRVNDKTAPTITILDEDKFNNDIEVGKYFEVPTATLKKEGVDVDGTTRWEIYNKSAGAEYTLSSNGFTPTSEGTFYIRYYGVDDYGNDTVLEDSMFTVTAKDTIAPVIELDPTERFPYSVEWAPAENTDYVEINIPVAFATDEYRGQVEVVYTVTGPNNIKPTISDNASNDNLKTFKATAEGKYTIVYSAVDEAGNEADSITKVVCVGDCVDPTITWKNQEKDLPSEIELGQTYELKISEFLTLKDDKTTDETTLRQNVTVTLTGPDGTTVSNLIANNAGYKYEFTKTGEYTLKITVKDEAGNSTTDTKTIIVPADDVETNKVSPVLGTVLVVLSVVVLGGVVVYFVASNKKKPTKKSASKKK